MSSAVWQLAFDDQFNGTRLDAAKWSHRKLGIREGSRKRSQSSTRVRRVSAGAPCTSGSATTRTRRGYFLNGHIGTQGKFAYRYGVSAARIKFQSGADSTGASGCSPSPRPRATGSPAKTGAEIDVVEFFGKGYPSGGLAHFLYSYPRQGMTNKYGKVFPGAAQALRGKSDTWWSRYHVFSVDWTASGYVFRIDGDDHLAQQQGRLQGAAVPHPEPAHLRLGASAAQPGTLPSDMKVDWVRVWQR